MPQFDSYPQLTALARGDIVGVIKDVSEATPESQTKYIEAQDLLKFGSFASKVSTVAASGTVTLANSDPILIDIDPNGADRDVSLPAKGDDNHIYVLRHTGASHTLTVKRSGGATVTTLEAGELKYIIPSTINDFGTLAGAALITYDMLSTLVNSEVSITGADTATISKQHVCSGSSNYTVTLPAASGNTGKFLSFRFTNTGITTLDGNSAETIDGVATRSYYQGQTVILYCNGSNWNTINAVMADRGVELFADVFICSTAPTKVVASAQMYNLYFWTALNGDTWDAPVFLSKGSYTVTVLGVTGSTSALSDWTLDGVSQTTGMDQYSASTVYNVEKTFTLTVLETGYHKLRATVNGKHASSGGYALAITNVYIKPSAY